MFLYATLPIDLLFYLWEQDPLFEVLTRILDDIWKLIDQLIYFFLVLLSCAALNVIWLVKPRFSSDGWKHFIFRWTKESACHLKFRSRRLGLSFWGKRKIIRSIHCKRILSLIHLSLFRRFTIWIDNLDIIKPLGFVLSHPKLVKVLWHQALTHYRGSTV
jgi:hypothetical protein